MKLTRIENTDRAFQITSIGKKVVANIVRLHPEFTLVDESMIIFSDTNTYYKFVEDKNLYHQPKQEVNVPNLLSIEGNITDVVKPLSYMHKNISSITEISYEGGKLYYLTRTTK